MNKTNQRIAMEVSRNTIIANVFLALFKLAAGILGHSAAMISDAVHSLSDVLSTVIVIIGIRLAGQAPDKEHPYGHDRLECVAALILSFILFATGLNIGGSGIRTILNGHYDQLTIPGTIALTAAVISIIVKEIMYWYTRKAAKTINSGALLADAWHHRSDALSSIGSFIGILGARIGFPVLDSAACLFICLFIFKVAYDVFKDAISKMTDRACDDQTVTSMSLVILAQEQVLTIDQLKTRLFGNRIYVDVEISVYKEFPLHISHEIAHTVHDALEKEFPEIKHCMVHVNPSDLTEA